MTSGSVQQSWARIEAWLREHAPETYATLNPPAEEAAIAAAEEQLGVALPADLRSSLLIHDGAAPGPAEFMVYGRYGLSSAARIPQTWRMLTDLLREEFDDDWMIGHWWHPQWIPFAEDNAACQLIVDGRPGTGYGQAATRDKSEGAGFGGSSSWPSYEVLLAETADLLVGNRFDHTTVPKVVSRRLTWTWLDEIADRPRSILDLAAAAPPPEDPTPPTQPPVSQPAGHHAVTRAFTARLRTRLMSSAEYRPQPNYDSPDWLVDHGHCCLTFLRGTENELITALGGDPDDAGHTSRCTGEQAKTLEASWRNGYRPVIRVGRVGEWAFGFEAGRDSGISGQVLRRLSAGTRAVSLAVDAAFVRLRSARDGVLLGGFDSRYPDRIVGSEPDVFRTLLAEANLVPADPERYIEDDVSAALALAIRLGPGEFDQRILGQALRTAAVLPLLADPATQPRRIPVQVDPDLFTAIEFATEPQLRAAVAAGLRRVVVTTELADHPEVAEALAEAGEHETGPIDGFSPLGLLLRTQHAQAHAAFASRVDRVDRAAHELITEPERRAWQYRGRLADLIGEFIARPAIVSAYSLMSLPEQFSQREEFLAVDLAGVDVPADAITRLAAAERQRGTASVPQHVPGARKSRRARQPLRMPGAGRPVQPS